MSRAVGVDIGSVTTKVLVLGGGRVTATFARRTGSPPGETAAAILAQALGSTDGVPVVVTGYGRVNVPFPARDVTEITCHARGVHHLFPEAGTVIEVGGQDAKVIRLARDGRVLDFAMNDKCAAGTGRFLEVMAGALEVSLEELGSLAAQADGAVEISNMCTVFAESEVISHLARGQSRERVAAGVHLAIAKRLSGLVRRVGLGGVVVFTGGVARNVGMRWAIEKVLGREVLVPEEPLFTGALGAALLAIEGGR